MIEGGSGVFEIDMMTAVCSRDGMSFKEMNTLSLYRLDGGRDLRIYVALQ